MFPTDQELNKSQEIENNYLLYIGEFNRVLKYFKLGFNRDQKLEVVENLAGAISRVFADLVFLEPIKIRHENPQVEKELKEIAFENDFDTVLWESAIAQSYAGFTAFEGRLVNGKSILEELSPSTCFPQFNQRNINEKFNQFIISWPVEINKQQYVFVKKHVIGYIYYELWLSDKGNKLLSPASLSIYDPNLPDFEETGLDYIPVWIIRNPKTGRESLGFSDYNDIKPLLKELSRVLSQIANELKNFGDAMLAVPPGVLDENGKAKKKDMQMIEVGNNDGGLLVPEYITNSNPQIDKAFMQVDKMIEAIARVSEVSSILFEMNKNGGAEKVGALRLRLLRTLAKVKRKTKFYSRQLKMMLAHAYNWQNPGKKIKPMEINIEFKDGLPEDIMEKIQAESLRMASDLQTTKDAIRNIDGLEGENLKAKVKEIEEGNQLDLSKVPQISI